GAENITDPIGWSAIVHETSRVEKDVSLAELTYLADFSLNAPYQNFVVGNEFRLYEGPHLVGTGTILEIWGIRSTDR
ncbi:MAG: hypothetical protein LBC38_01815, partial [Oscillospiraceae bacterium]|nr:hypothetical protein [Oscillospiraceae bacterium]